MLEFNSKDGIVNKLGNTPYKRIQQMEKEDNEKGNTQEVMGVEATMEGAKQVSILQEDEDETSPIKNQIRKQKVVIDLKNNAKIEDQKEKNKDQPLIWKGDGQKQQ